MGYGHPRHAYGARTVLGTPPELTTDQWALVVELLYQEQHKVREIQHDKADVLKRSVNAGPALVQYAAQVKALREQIQRHVGPDIGI